MMTKAVFPFRFPADPVILPTGCFPLKISLSVKQREISSLCYNKYTELAQ